jgi:hypothetical protein
MANLPPSLQAGTPVSERGQNPFQNYPSPSGSYSSTSYDRRDSDNSRRESTVSIGSIRTTRNYSYGEGDTYDPEQTLSPLRDNLEPPPLPTFSPHTSYEHVQNPFTAQGAVAYKPARKQSLMSRIGSIRSNRRSRYGSVGSDDTDPGFNRGARHQRLSSIDEGDGSGYGIDLSTLESPIEARQQAPERQHKRDYSGTGSREINPVDLAAALGSGLENVSLRFLNSSNDGSMTDVTTRHNAQTLADESGEILAVQERHASDASVSSDITALSGGFNARRASEMSTPGAAGKTSYFFPADRAQASWRPFTMHWMYIALLVVVALVFAGVQEYLCQKSIRLKKENLGLLTFKRPQDLSLTAYFVWQYMPTIVLLAYGIMWMVVDFEVKRLEPFYQLSKKSGATARDSLNLDYITFLSYFVPLKALRSKQYAVVLSSMATLLTGSLTPILQSASVVMEPKQQRREEAKPKFVRIDPSWSRAVSITLLVVAVHGILLLIELARRKSGLLSDPKGIAGIASMATRSHILNDFQGLDRASNQVIHNRLRTRRYNLHRSTIWQGEFIKNAERAEKMKEEHPHPTLLRLHAGIPFIIYMFLFGVSIPVFMFVRHANVVTGKLPWLMTLLATIVKLVWGCLDMDLRVIEPYYILSLGGAPPSVLTMDYTGTVPGWLTIKAAMQGQYLTALVGGGSILTEILTVCVTSFSVDGHKFIAGHGGNPNDKDSHNRYNTDQTFRSFWVSFALALGILIYLITMAIVVYMKRSHKFLPRQPGTIAGVLAYIHQSKMLLDFVDTEEMNSAQVTKHLERLQKTYGLGWFTGRDGEDHCGVDQEPLQSKYQFGVDWTETHVSGAQIGSWEHY